MADEIIEELWNIKDGIAREYGYDMDALVAHLTAQGKHRDTSLINSVSPPTGQGDCSGEFARQLDQR